MTTIQLRRYTLVEGERDAFIAWWREMIPPLRSAAGFTVEFAYMDDAAGEFVWAVSVPGDQAEFTRIDAAYQSSDARRIAFDGLPERVARAQLSLVEPVY